MIIPIACIAPVSFKVWIWVLFSRFCLFWYIDHHIIDVWTTPWQFIITPTMRIVYVDVSMTEMTHETLRHKTHERKKTILHIIYHLIFASKLISCIECLRKYPFIRDTLLRNFFLFSHLSLLYSVKYKFWFHVWCWGKEQKSVESHLNQNGWEVWIELASHLVAHWRVLIYWHAW